MGACRPTGASWWWATSPTLRSSTRWSPGRDAVVHFAAESHNDNSLRDPSPFVHDQPDRHLSRSSRPHADTACGCTTSAPTRSTATSSSTTRTGSPRARRTTRRAPTPRPRPARTCSSARGCAPSGSRRPSATAPTTTGPTSTSRSSSRGRSPTCSTASARGCTARGSTSATGSTSTTTADAVLTIIERGTLGETYLIGADGETQQPDVVRAILRLMGGRRTTSTTSPTAPVTTCATRSTAPSCAPSSAGPRAHGLRGRARGTIEWYRDARGLVASAQGQASRRSYAESGQ